MNLTIKVRTPFLNGIAIFISWLIVYCAHAQPNPIRFRKISVENGLSNTNALSVMQDNQGLIWIGTGYGLNRYDSYEFKQFNNNIEDSTSISSDVVSTIFQDSQSRLWIGTGNGINLFDQKKNEFKPYNANFEDDLSSKYIRIFFEGNDRKLWVGTSKGLYHLSEIQNEFIPFPDKRNDQLRVNTIFEYAEGKLLIGTFRGLYFVSATNFERAHLADPDMSKILDGAEVKSITEDELGNLWIATEGVGVFVVDRKWQARQYTVENTGGKLLSNFVRKIVFGDNNDVWMATKDGLTIYDSRKQEFTSYQHDIYDPNSLSFNSIRDIFKDNSGGLWVATYAGGINYYNPANNLFNLIEQKLGGQNTLNDNKITAIAVTNNDKVWIGTTNGLNHYQISTDSYKHFQNSRHINSLINDDIKSISVDASDNLWIGTYHGMSYFETSTERFHNYQFSTLDSVNPLINQVHATLIDHRNNLWIGTNGAGLIYFNIHSGLQTRYVLDKDVNHSLTANHIDYLYEDRENNLWVGTRMGLDVLPENSSKFIHTSLSEIMTQCIAQDRFGKMWIASQGQGLFLYDLKSDSSLNFKMDEGLPGNVILGILEDENSHLWLSTNNGLSKMIISRDSKGEYVDADFVNYQKSDGLQGNQFMLGSAFKSKDGTFFFGGINGLNYFNPDQIPIEIKFSPVILTGLKIKNQPITTKTKGSPLTNILSFTEELDLSYDQSEFTIEFAAMNYLNSGKNIYAYKLEGFDNNWNYIGTQRNATFTYPPPGSYVFKVKSSTNKNKWPDEYTSINIIVRPPFWKQSWAIAVYIVCFLMLLYLYHRVSQVYFSLKREKELSKSKFEFFTNVSHEIKTPLTLILAPLEGLIQSYEGNAKIHNQLAMMKRNGDRLIELINQLLVFRKFESGAIQVQAAKGNIARFSKEIFLSFMAMAEKKTIDFQFDSPEYIEVWYDRDKLEKILLNLLSNAFKFTNPGGKIVFKLTEHKDDQSRKYKAGYCSLSVIDNGIGIAEGQLKSIFERFVTNGNRQEMGTGIGLNLAKRLVSIHGGEIAVTSEKFRETGDNETIFTVIIPLGNQHFKRNQIIEDFRDSDEQISEYIKNQGSLVNSAIAVPTENGHFNDQIMLVIEDNYEVRKFIVSMFNQDFQVNEAENGEEGIQKAYELIPDIIISDVMMPVSDGITVCSTLKNDLRTSHIPIILLTARTPLVFRVEAIETGADDYVTKPFSTTYLKSRVNNLILNRQKVRDKFRKDLVLQPKSLAITSPDEKFLDTISRYLETHMDDVNLNMDDIGKELGMSRSNLYRKVKAFTGLTTVEFVRSFRIRRAAQLLGHSEYNVNQVAYMVGFQDVDYFRKCFKDEFKITPSKFSQHPFPIG